MLETVKPESQHAARLAALCAQLQPFAPLSREMVPERSILKEFIG